MERNGSGLRVLIADDHHLVRQGIRMLLDAQPDLKVVGEAGDGAEVVRLASELAPDLVIMDIAMPTMDGLEATRAIRQAHPDLRVLVLTMHEGEDYFFKILAAGAAGCVLKRAVASDLIAAIHAVASGQIFLYPPIAKKLVADYLRRVQTDEQGARTSYDGLTAREREVLTLVAEGLSNREIAERLSVGLTTVQTHYAHIVEKLNLRNRTELVKYALRHHLIDLPD
ncbi:MAG: response regulator transcription factor [Chloroflexi bacterium]|nr:response regulator transcription factor [Chloroflexota bacterium]